jgi:hypothetical protein
LKPPKKSNGNSHLLSREPTGKALDQRLATEVVARLRAGDTPARISSQLHVGYMAVYKIAIGKTWKELTSGERLIPEREGKIGPEQREWAERMYRVKKKRKAFIARKLQVTETTVARILADARLVMAHNVCALQLSSGSHKAAIRRFKITPEEAAELMALAASTPLPRRLQGQVDDE